MKNRLQFNRHFALYNSREEAITALNNRIADTSFIPLIGEPIVLRYKDGAGNIQVILAIGKKAGTTLSEREYHVVDTAELNEKIEFDAGRIDNLSAGTVFEFDAVNNRVSELSATTESFSGATDDFIKRIIAAAGLDEDGSYIHDHKTHFIDEVISLAEADHELDAAAYDILTNATASADTLNSKIDGEIVRATAAEDSISGIVDTFSAATVGEITRLDDKIDAATVSSDDKTVLVTTSATGTDLSINIDGVTIAKDNNGVLSTKLTVAKLETPSSVNVKEEYELIDNNGVRHGETIKIYKDSALYRVYLGHVDDSLVSYEDPTVIPGTGDAALCFIYQRVDGLYELVAVNVESFLEESEFKDGLAVNNHEVRVKIDNASEEFLSVSLDGVKLGGVQDAINTAQAEEEARAIAVENAIQVELDKTQTGAGLASDGSYIHDHSANYIDIATSLADADHKLDAALMKVSDDATSSANTLNSAIEAEKNRAIAAENALSASVVSEITRAIATENSISGEVSTIKESITVLSSATVSEINRATAAENSISGQVTTLSANVITFSSTTVNEIASLSRNTDAIQAELDKTQSGAGLENDGSYRAVENAKYISDAVSLRDADAKLDVALKKVSDDATASANTLNNAIEAEKSRAISAENAINNNVESLGSVVERLSAGTVAEVNRAVSAETTLDGRVRNLENASVTGENAIGVESTGLNKKVTLVIDSNDNVLTQSLGGLKTTLGLKYDSTSSKVQLIGNNNAVISEFDSSDFIKDGMIESVTFDPETNILLIVWNTAAGHEPTLINLSDLVNVYTVAPESHTFMEIDSYVIKLNADITDGLASFNYTRRISAITDNIISATGLNIGDPGTYPHHDETHYIKNAGSLDQADVLLDTAIWGTSEMYVDVNNRLNNLSALTRDFSAATYNTFMELSAATMSVSGKVDEVATGLAALSAVTEQIITGGTGGDVTELSAATIALSAATVEAIDDLEILSGAFIDNTYVVSLSLNDLNNKVNEISGNTGIVDGLSGAVISLSSATVAISNNVSNVSGAVINLSAATAGLSAATVVISGHVADSDNNIQALSASVISDEFVIAQAFNDVNDRIVGLSGSMASAEVELAVVEALSGDMNEAFDEIASLSAGTIQLSADTRATIDQLSGGTVGINTRVTSLSAATTGLSTSLTNLSGAVQSMSSPFVASVGTGSAILAGNSNTAFGNYAIAEGDTNIASGNCSHAEGSNTTASGIYSHAEGQSTIASGTCSHAEGRGTTASGYRSHAEGDGTTASGDNSHAEGQSTIASGTCSHAEGSNTTASGYCSHAEGWSTTASGPDSHSEGESTTAHGWFSHAEGWNTTALNQSEHAEGQFNASHKTTTGYGNSGNTQHSVGIGGSSADTKNAFEIMQNGDAYLYGVGGYDGIDIANARTLQTQTRNSFKTMGWGGNAGGPEYVDFSAVSFTNAFSFVSYDSDSEQYQSCTINLDKLPPLAQGEVIESHVVVDNSTRSTSVEVSIGTNPAGGSIYIYGPEQSWNNRIVFNGSAVYKLDFYISNMGPDGYYIFIINQQLK